MSTGLVSVIIPTFNRASFLPTAIQSVLKQTYRNYEIIVVDDGSTDETHGVLETYRDRIIRVYQEHRGLPAARNAGVLRAAGKYLVFLDSDDLLLPRKLEAQVTYLERNREVDIVYGNGYTLNALGVLGPLEPYVVPCAPHEVIATLLWRNLFAIHVAMVRATSLPSSAPFDESLGAYEDWDLWLRMALRGRTIGYLDKRVAVYRRHEGNMDAADPDVFVQPLTIIVQKVIGESLDRQMPATLRMSYRLGYLDVVLAFGSLQVVAAAFRDILWPGRMPSLSGCAALIEAVQAAGISERRWDLPLLAALRARLPAAWRKRARGFVSTVLRVPRHRRPAGALAGEDQ